MKVETKQKYAIEDELPRLLFDVFGWISTESDEDEDAIENLAEHVARGIRDLIPEHSEGVTNG